MDTIVCVIDKDDIDQTKVLQAARILDQGGLVAFPTETVYGLGADGLNIKAAEQIYLAKGRPSDNPLILHIADKDSLKAITKDVSDKGMALVKEFWPGPLTLIFNKSEIVPYEVTGGLETVAVRMPKHSVASAIIGASKGYIAAPSANLSGRPSPTKASHVMEDLNRRVDMIVDGGQVGIGIESTIVDMTVDPPMILRPGFITKEMLERVVGPVVIDQAILTKNQDEQIKPKAPGMKYRHYAPRGQMFLVKGSQQKVVERINELAKKRQIEGFKCGVICLEEHQEQYHLANVCTMGNKKDNASSAYHLYDVLRHMDELEIDYIYSESFEDGELSQALMNRLLKAAGYQVIYVEDKDEI